MLTKFYRENVIVSFQIISISNFDLTLSLKLDNNWLKSAKDACRRSGYHFQFHKSNTDHFLLETIFYQFYFLTRSLQWKQVIHELSSGGLADIPDITKHFLLPTKKYVYCLESRIEIVSRTIYQARNLWKQIDTIGSTTGISFDIFTELCRKSVCWYVSDTWKNKSF